MRRQEHQQQHRHQHQHQPQEIESSQLLMTSSSRNVEKSVYASTCAWTDVGTCTSSNNTHTYTVEEALKRARRILYASHLFATCTGMGWTFCLTIFLTALANDQSLVFVSTYGLFSGIVVCMFGSIAGASLDNPHRSRLHIAQGLILVKYCSLVVASMCCFSLLRMDKLELDMQDSNSNSNHNSDADADADADSANEDDQFLFKDFTLPLNVKSMMLLTAIHIFGAMASLTDEAITVAMERDWIVIMSKFSSSGIDSDLDSDLQIDSDEELHQDDMPTEFSVGSISVAHSNVNEDDEGISLHEQEGISLHKEESSHGGFSAISSIGTTSMDHDHDSGNSNDNGTNECDCPKEQKEKMWLTQTNTVMKQIYLLSKIGTPAIAGIFVASFDGNNPLNTHQYNLSYAAAILGVLNLVTLYVEYTCTRMIYDLVPPLSVRERSTCSSSSPMAHESTLELELELSESPPKTIGCGILKLPQSISLFLEQPVSYGGLAMMLLYLNVLTFSSLMTGYLVWIGVNYGTIGVLRGISSAIGLLGTVVFQISIKQYGLATTGMWSISFQFGCLGLSYLSLYIHHHYFELRLWLLVVGVCLSRVGLWVFDLTITQYMQQEIPEEIRGVIGGVQNSLNGFFDLGKYALGLIFSNPEDFHVLVSIGFSSVGGAMLLYLFGIYQRREQFRGHN